MAHPSVSTYFSSTVSTLLCSAPLSLFAAVALLVATLLGVLEPLLVGLLFWRHGLSSGSSLARTIRVVSIVLVIRGAVEAPGFLNPEVADEVTDLVVVVVTLLVVTGAADFCLISASRRMNSATSAPSVVLDASLIFFLGVEGVVRLLMLDELVVLLTGRADFLAGMLVDPVERLLEVTEDDVMVVLRLLDDEAPGRLMVELAGELRIWPESDRLVTLLVVLEGVLDDVIVLLFVLLDDDVILRVVVTDGSGA